MFMRGGFLKKNRELKIRGTLLDKNQIKKYLEKIAMNHNVIDKSEKETYPIQKIEKNFKKIEETYKILNDNLKNGINIHQAGEWILDNFYVIDEAVKTIKHELSLKKYVDFPGMSKGDYKGFARIYVLASEIVAYTEGKINENDLEEYIESYQLQKTLTMEEIWNIGIFLNVAIIENISELCEKIYISEIEKCNAENIVKRIIEGRNEIKSNRNITSFFDRNVTEDKKYSFMEYMSYALKRYGKKGYIYEKILNEVLEIDGHTLEEIIEKEHFNIAVTKVIMGNNITSLKNVQRINFLNIFERVNGVEKILRDDPSNIYTNMDNNTKAYYRETLKRISKKTKISEIYIAKKIIEMAKRKNKKEKEGHIGYYLIDNGKSELYKELNYVEKFKKIRKNKDKIFVYSNIAISIIITWGLSNLIYFKTMNRFIYLISFILFFIPSTEISTRIFQYLSSKFVKSKRIPKMNVLNNIEYEDATMVVFPTIVDSKEKVRNIINKLEVSYLANKSENIYFTLLGDCTTRKTKKYELDKEIIEEGIKNIERLNLKYGKIFNFIYREREYNEKEEAYLGWERKRGLLTQFNEYMLDEIKNPFLENTFEYNGKPKIKYIITLDSDTELVANSAFYLIGSMTHILNKPVIDELTNTVKSGYGIIQPRVSVDLKNSYKNLFTRIFANNCGVDSYSNAVSDFYQDNFGEGIYTGKGIYDLRVFSKVLKSEIPENTVLSHDLLEGNYLRCGFASDIVLLDGCPERYNSYINRLMRWIRGDWQISKWAWKKNKLNLISRYKIIDNLRRSLLEVSILISFIYLYTLNIICKNKMDIEIYTILLISIISYILEIINKIIFKKGGEKKYRTFSNKVSGIKNLFIKSIITIATLPYKAIESLKAIVKTNYRKFISKKHLLEWSTSEEVERQSKSDVWSYIKSMKLNIVLGIVVLIRVIIENDIKNIFLFLISLAWILAPIIMWFISKSENKGKIVNQLAEEEKNYVKQIGERTWLFFEEYLTEKNNYLIPDNFQGDRREKVVKRTSSTNIGLSLLAVLSAYDMKFIDLNKAIELINKIIITIEGLPKWNGHLYNWYDIEKKTPLIPRYISTVDSGNFIGYLYVLKTFLMENIDIDSVIKTINIIDNLIKNTDFSVLYKSNERLFSIGYDLEENKLSDSYYDLLASEARQASFVAIAKKDVPVEHWYSLSRTLTSLGKYRGLVSWSGTAFEYLMPNINIPSYPGSLLYESLKFSIYCQKEYAKKMKIPFGISESAFNSKDLKGNYQYKACGIPWIGLKRGLADDLVVSSYAGVLTILDNPRDEVENLKKLEEEGMYKKYGFYESIDYTPKRQEKGDKSSVVKTYMAHHQGLILLTINNLFNDNILQTRFMNNPEMKAIDVLLEETIQDVAIVTKDRKEKLPKLEYKDYGNYTIREYNEIDNRLITGNVISNGDYTIAMNQKGEGFSKYKDIYINRFKNTDDYSQGIFFTFKNITSQQIWSTDYSKNIDKANGYKIKFMPDSDVQEILEGDLKTNVKTIISYEDTIEIRRITLENKGSKPETIEITSYFEPILSKVEEDYAHPAFNNLFLKSQWDSETESLIFERKNRSEDDKKVFLATTLSTNSNTIGDIEYEIDKNRFWGRGNLGTPQMVKHSMPFSNQIGLTTEPIVALRKIIKLESNSRMDVDFLLSIGENYNDSISNIKKYKCKEKVDKELEFSKARIETENRYLQINGKDIEIYQKIISYGLFNRRPFISKEKKYQDKYDQNQLWQYGISGDLPIILVKVRNVNESKIIKDILKAYEYYRNKNMKVEIVIINQEKNSYQKYLKDEIKNQISNSKVGYMKDRKGGIFVLDERKLNHKDIELLELISIVVIDASKGNLENIIRDLEEEYVEKYKSVKLNSQIIKENRQEDFEKEGINILEDNKNIMYYNGYGGFINQGKEYIINVNKNLRTPAVWSHVLANRNFGTVITESMGGYSWHKNSRLNRISTWENYSTFDIPSEIIYLKDVENKKTWSLGLNPKPDNQNYNIIYGFGYAKYIHESDGIEQELEVFVPKEDSCKINILRLKNKTLKNKKIKIYYYIKLTMGEDILKNNKFILIEKDKENNMITAKKIYNNSDISDIAYIASSEKIKSYTGDKEAFLGVGKIENPDGINKEKLNEENGLGNQACMAFEIEINIEKNSQKEIILTLGADNNIKECKSIANKYLKVSNAKEELENVMKYWKELLRKNKYKNSS